MKLDPATLQESKMSQDLIDDIETDLNPFDLEVTEDVDMLETRMTTAISLFERIVGQTFKQIQERKIIAESRGQNF